MTTPMTTERIPVHRRFACGRRIANGRTPRIDTQITALRPTRSPIGPPKKVPAATAARNTNSISCDSPTETANVSMR